jgi:deazaflavin-dependent oxidoreductase (nitroreductase family)
MSADALRARPSLVARLTRAIARTSGPLARPLAGRRFLPLWAVVHHRGRRSGRSYAVPVAIRGTETTLTIPLPWGRETQWLRNVLAADGCVVRWRGRDVTGADPQVLGMETALEAFHPVQRAVLRAAGVASYLRLTINRGAEAAT